MISVPMNALVYASVIFFGLRGIENLQGNTPMPQIRAIPATVARRVTIKDCAKAVIYYL
jgi:hypothetical protein